jgi:subtilisin family serine protease
MWRAVITCVAVALSAGATEAAERVLLYPQTLTASPMARTVAPASLTELRKTAAEKGSVSVMVGLRVPFGAEGLIGAASTAAQRAEIAAATTAIQTRFAAAVSRAPNAFRSYESIPFLTITVTAEELERLAADPDVISLTENHADEPLLAASVPMVGGNAAHAAGFTGSGQAIAIIDTGVDKNHPFLGGRVVSEACFSTTVPGQSVSVCPGGVQSSTAAGSGMHCAANVEGCDHGTHVAGIAAGASNSMSGVGRGASIIAIQVFSNFNGEALSYTSDYIKGLERVYALRNQFSIAAVNMSLGGGRFYGTCDAQNPALLAAINNLRSVGIATIVSSGNESYTDSISRPACISSAVSVGAVSASNWGSCQGDITAADRVACYSNSANFLSLLAPGSPINSSVPNNGYAVFHGTSMAAPHVAGAWAVIKQKSPKASVDQIQTALQNTGTPVTDHRNGIVKPRINVKAALDQVIVVGPPVVLSYKRSGRGSGSVSFSPAGSRNPCTGNCNNSFATGTTVTLTATPAQGSVFAGWSGACSGSANSCVVNMTEKRDVVAVFNRFVPDQTLTYTKGGTGDGSVSFSPGGSVASCDASCTSSFPGNTRVEIVAQAAAGSVFKGWQGACKRTRRCVVTMSQARSVTANFDVPPVFTLTYAPHPLGTGTGTVSFSQPTGLAPCTGSCTNSFPQGTLVTLTAQAGANSTFVRWGGACRGRSTTCTVTMSKARSVTARFTAPTTIGALAQP